MKQLVVYLVCEPETPELAEAAVEGGANIVELGIPFSDPLAEGPTIRLASERALARGMRTKECLECIAATRARVDVPLVPMTYAAILEAYGHDRFVQDARQAGATSAIVVDLPTALYISAVEIEGTKVVGQFPAEAGGTTDEFGMVFDLENPLADCVNTALAQIRQIGTLAAIEQQWLSDNITAPVITE